MPSTAFTGSWILISLHSPLNLGQRLSICFPSFQHSSWHIFCLQCVCVCVCVCVCACAHIHNASQDLGSNTGSVINLGSSTDQLPVSPAFLCCLPHHQSSSSGLHCLPRWSLETSFQSVLPPSNAALCSLSDNFH